MNPQLPLAGCVIGVSISATKDLAERGMDPSDINRFVTHLADVLLGAGARLTFGHDWRPSGVMKAVAEFAVHYQVPTPDSTFGEQPRQPLILNFVAPPDRPYLELSEEAANDLTKPLVEEMRQRLRGIVEARQAPAPDVRMDAPIFRPAALSRLRERLNEVCHARICLGGPLEGYQGWFPGVTEEAYLALQSDKPLYLGAIFGGAAEWVIQALSDDNQPENKVQGSRAVGDPRSRPEPLDFRHHPLAWNGLEAAEQELLHRTTSPQRCTELILRGLCKWWKKNCAEFGSKIAS